MKVIALSDFESLCNSKEKLKHYGVILEMEQRPHICCQVYKKNQVSNEIYHCSLTICHNDYTLSGPLRKKNSESCSYRNQVIPQMWRFGNNAGFSYYKG